MKSRAWSRPTSTVGVESIGRQYEIVKAERDALRRECIALRAAADAAKALPLCCKTSALRDALKAVG